MKNYLLVFKVFRQLGWQQGFLYLFYQFLLHSGILRFQSPIKTKTIHAPISVLPLKISPINLKLIFRGQEDKLIEAADPIVEGQIIIFGGIKQKIDFSQPEELKHWTQHRSVWLNGQDIKLYWEAGRFGWATTLARAYTYNKDEKYAKAFWQYTEDFLEKNPTNSGLHWVSAQEVAIRLINLCFCFCIFAGSEQSTKPRQKLISQAIAAHAERIPPTMIYARAQNNNHLITEALGLYTAAAFLPDHPRARKWRTTGWKWLNHAFQTQIRQDGSYIQNSNNYHRLMLQSGLWAKKIADIHGDIFPQETSQALAAATKHLYSCLDKNSGRVPNLGPNDGAYILPLSSLPIADYRPVLQAAGKAFLGQPYFPSGFWDEMTAYLVKKGSTKKINHIKSENTRLDSVNSWASLRAVQHQSRPGHADQLHVDLWWRGLNIAMDAGTYLYNAPPPWQNALSATDVHNTICLNGRDQMLKASRFLYLDWAQAKLTEKSEKRILAEHDGYRKQGLLHRRSLELLDVDTWKISDIVKSSRYKKFTTRLHWLLPDWPWKIEKNKLQLESPHGLISLQIKCESPIVLSLVRAGKLVHGESNVAPHWGWHSPTYAIKNPALSLAVHVKTKTQLNLSSLWNFPK